jgi:hypothetical protein
MAMTSVIAERTWFAVAPDGKGLDISVRVGQPYRASDVSWACPIAVTGIYDKLQPIEGIDSLQAIELALRLAAQLLCGFVDRGGTLFWERNGDPVSVVDSMPFATGNP